MRTVLKVIVKWKLSVLAVVASLTLATASAALAGSGVGGVFNLGKTQHGERHNQADGQRGGF